jgi:hypothetical protein
MYPSSGEQFREIENVKEAFTIAHQTSRFDGKADCDRRWMQSKLHSDGAGGWPTSPERATDRHKRVHSRPVPRACQQEPQFAILTTSPLAQTPRWWKLSSEALIKQRAISVPGDSQARHHAMFSRSLRQRLRDISAGARIGGGGLCFASIRIRMFA